MESSIFKNTRLTLALPFVLACAGTSFATNGDLGAPSCDGSDEKPYQISDAADLKAFADKVNAGLEENDIRAVLTADICLNACGEGESVLKDDGTLNGTEFTPWTPIGVGGEYAGQFDGKGHTIRGLYVNDNELENVGLFAKIDFLAKIQNVSVEDSYIKGGKNVGGVVGYNYGGVENCVNKGTVSGTKYVGGVVGYDDQGDVAGSNNSGTVSGTDYVGGVVGYNGASSNVLDSYNTGAVNGDGGCRVSGVVGYNMGDIFRSYNKGSVNGSCRVGGVVGESYGRIFGSYNEGSVDGDSLIGGVAGYAHGDVYNSYNSGTVSGDSVVGGVVGELYALVYNGYNTGAVKARKEAASYIGGVAGIIELNGGVEYCYNTGAVTGASYIGGIAGYNDMGLVINSYNAGDVKGHDIKYIGGIVGENDYGTVINVYNSGYVQAFSSNYVGGIAGLSYCGTVINVYNSGIVIGKGSSDVGSVVGVSYVTESEGAFSNSYYNTDVDCEKCNDVDGATGMSAENFYNGKVAELLHDWCEKDGDNCKEGGLNGSIWGQDLRTENSMPDFSGVVGFKYGGVAFVGLKDGTAASAHIDATSDVSVSFPEDIKVTGEIKIERSFAWNGYSTIMLPFQPEFNSDADTIADVNFYKFATYANDKIEVNSISQKDLERNTPYLVSANGAWELVFKNGGVFNTQKGGAYDQKEKVYKTTLENGWSIYGSYDYKTWKKGDKGLGKTYGFVGWQDCDDPEDVGLFKKVGAGAYLYPMRAYLEYEIPVKKVRIAPNSARAAASVTASLPETIDVVVVEKDAKTGEETTKLIGSINSRTGEFKAADRYFDLRGRNVGKKPAAKGSFYRK